MKYIIACLTLLSVVASRSEDISDILYDLGDSDYADVKSEASNESTDEPRYKSTKVETKTFEGDVTPVKDKGLIIFSDDGCRVTVDETKVFDQLNNGQALPKLDKSFSPIKAFLSKKKKHHIKVEFSNIAYTGKGDIDGCTLFLYDIKATFPTDEISWNPSKTDGSAPTEPGGSVLVKPGVFHDPNTSVKIKIWPTDLPQDIRDSFAKLWIVGFIQNVKSLGETTNYIETQRVYGFHHGTPRLDEGPSAFKPWVTNARGHFSKDEGVGSAPFFDDVPFMLDSYTDPRTHQEHKLQKIIMKLKFNHWLAATWIKDSNGVDDSDNPDDFIFIKNVNWSIDATIQFDGYHQTLVSQNISAGIPSNGKGSASPSLEQPIANNDSYYNDNPR